MNALELRRRTLGKGVCKKTVEGNPAIAQGSLSRRYPGITMQGWTEQAQYEGKNLFDISKVIGSDNGNLKVEGNTIVVKNAQYGQAGKDPHKFSDYFPNAEIGKTYRLDFDYINITIIYIQGAGTWGAKQSKVMTQEILDGIVYFYSTASEENVYSNIMLNEGTTAFPYEPYTGNQPSPSPEYPQEIVNAGKYNEEIGKYEVVVTISDKEQEPTKQQTVTLTSDRPLTKWDKLEKRDGVWGWVYKSAEVVLDGSKDEVWGDCATEDGYYTEISTSVENDLSADGYAFSDRFLFVNTFSYKHPVIVSPSRYYYFLNVKRYGETVPGWRAYLQTNPVTILYETESETFVPLSTSEQEQMNELYTFRPTTVLSNDCECNMTLTYKTKKSLEVTT